MFIVHIKSPLAGVRSQFFVFYNENEADEFASSLHAEYGNIETHTEPAGEPTEVFEDWSF